MLWSLALSEHYHSYQDDLLFMLLNVHGTRHGKTQSVATGTAHKLKLDESAETSQRVSGGACMARNAAERN
jgi:hypothetical protein